MREKASEGLRSLRGRQNSAIAKVLFGVLNEKGITSKMLIDSFQEKYNEVLNSGNISGYRRGTLNIPPIFLWEACQLADVSVDWILSQAEQIVIGSNIENPVMNEGAHNDPAEKDILGVTFPPKDSFIVAPENKVFRGYWGTYYIYFTPTYSSGEGFIKGKLMLEKEATYVKARIELFAHRHNEKEIDLSKTYDGFLVYSNSVNCFYCILSSADVGEICVLMFRHISLNRAHLQCRLAAVLTASAGSESKNPTVHRMLISHDEIKDADVFALLPHLSLNHSVITISEQSLNEIAALDPRYKEVIDLIVSRISPTSYFQIRENTIRAQIRDLHSMLELPFITLLREYSFSPRYNKISKKADENIRKLLLAKGYFSSSK